MKIYTCTKPCTIGGQHFIIGDAVPGELIAPEREKALVKYGVLAVSEAAQPVADDGRSKDTGKAPEAPEKPAENPKAPDAPEAPEGQNPPDAADGEAGKATGKKVPK